MSMDALLNLQALARRMGQQYVNSVLLLCMAIAMQSIMVFGTPGIYTAIAWLGSIACAVAVLWQAMRALKTERELALAVIACLPLVAHGQENEQ